MNSVRLGKTSNSRGLGLLLRLATAPALCIAVQACSADAATTSRAGSKAGDGGAVAAMASTNPTGTENPGSSLIPAGPASPNTGGSAAGSLGSGAVIMNGPGGAISIDQTGADNPAGLGTDEVQKLMAGGPTTGMRWTYPYEGTVFPRGLLSPLLMWEGGAADAVYLHIKSRAFEYKGCLKPALDPDTMAPQLQIPQDVWDKAGQHTYGKDDPFTFELTARAGGSVAGPISLTLTIAQATIKGSIYYNSYASQLPGAAVGGNVLRIPPGGKAEVFLSTDCNGCHSLSADGSRMLSQISIGIGGSSYELVSGGPANPPAKSAGQRTAFGALYPDGSKYLSTSVAVPLAHSELAQPAGAPVDAALYDTATGQEVPDTNIPPGALMPMFSPDGTRLVFNDNAIDSAHGLAVMDYDVLADKASNYRMLDKSADPMRPGWPFFLPDDKAVVYVLTDGADFSGNGAFVGAGNLAGLAGPLSDVASLPVAGPSSDLQIVDLASGKTQILARAMGYDTAADATDDKTYLPFGAEELHQNYFPTVSPVAAGGYFWVFFDSIRHYGNLGLQRQLWGTAIDIRADGSYTTDPSHPAFYVPGQEFGAGNHRAFAALDPCKKQGDSCESGIDCCGGHCNLPEPEEFVQPVGTCSPPEQNTCSKRDERCSTSGDCCPPEPGQPANSCIAGFCAYVPLE